MSLSKETIPLKIGDVQIDVDNSEWVVVAVYQKRISRVRRNSLAHRIHAEGTPEIAKSLQVIVEKVS